MFRKIRLIIMAAAIGAGSIMTTGALAQSKYDERFATYPTYDGDDLEVFVDGAGTHFKLWSPKASAARVNLYDYGRYGKPYRIIEMKPDAATGVWSASADEKLYGKFYTFQILFDGKWKDETPGVWAKATGINGKRGAIIDLAATDPEGWTEDKGPEVKSFNDVIVYEMHHRDMSMHPSSGIAPPALRENRQESTILKNSA